MAGSTDPLADLRHDLCTPINQILGYSELLEEELAEGEAADPEDLRKIQQAARTMLALVRSRLTGVLVPGGGISSVASAPPLRPRARRSLGPAGRGASWPSMTMPSISICWPSALAVRGTW
jgi:signal transduction histidine kinase